MDYFHADENGEYILSLDFQQDTPYYVAGRPDGSWDECYSPLKATRFATEKAALKWIKANTTFAEYAVVVKYQEASDRYHAWLESGGIRRSFNPLDESLSVKYNKKKHDKFAVLDWWYRYNTKDDEESIRYEDYETWPKLYQLFECLWDFERYYKNYNSPEKYLTISVRVSKKVKFETFKADLDLVIDKLTYVDDEGDLTIKIFDHYCGEGGNFASLVRHNDGKWSVTGRWSKMCPDTTLEECFKYMQKHRWYDNDYSSSEENDEDDD